MWSLGRIPAGSTIKAIRMDYAKLSTFATPAVGAPLADEGLWLSLFVIDRTTSTGSTIAASVDTTTVENASLGATVRQVETTPNYVVTDNETPHVLIQGSTNNTIAGDAPYVTGVEVCYELPASWSPTQFQTAP